MSKITSEKLTKLQKKNLQNCKRKISKITREKIIKIAREKWTKLLEKKSQNCKRKISKIAREKLAKLQEKN